MSDTSAPFGAVVSTQRRFIDGAIEAQRSLSRGGLRLTRRSATAVVGIVPDDDKEKLLEEGVAGVFGPGTPVEETVEIVRSNVRER